VKDFDYLRPGSVAEAVAAVADNDDAMFIGGGTNLIDLMREGWPSAVTDGEPTLGDAEIRERMSGNLCRCGAYGNIVPAIAEAGS